MPGIKHFKDMESYRKYEAYKHIHLPKVDHERYTIYIGGKLYKPKHRR